MPRPEKSRRATPFQIFEDSFSIAALSLMTVLPVIEMIARQFRWSGIPGSAVVVQQLTLWIGMLGGMLASRSGRLLGLSSSSFLPESWIAPAKIFWSAALAAVCTCLAYASWVFVRSERESG
ncbi:MAG: TRAP transporter small permease subunit, partial [Bryobacteraceae bacterium]